MDSAKRFNEILDKYRSEAASQTDKGKRFERLMANFLKTYQVYDERFSDVWLWEDFPYRAQIRGKDIGIDLVALTTDREYWAVQAKCYAADAYITKRHVDTFLGPSGKTFEADSGNKTKFAVRLWISTTNKWNSEAQAEIQDQSPRSRGSASSISRARRSIGISWIGAAAAPRPGSSAGTSGTTRGTPWRPAPRPSRRTIVAS